MKKYCLHIFIFLAAMLTTGQLHAEGKIQDNLQLRLGGFLLADQSTEIEVSHSGVGATINIQETFKMESAAQVIRFDGYYRFNPKHAVQFSWYRIHNTSHTDKDFQWADQNISISGSLETFFNTDIYKVNYLYSFYHTDKVELALGVGLHIIALDVGFSGNYTTTGDTINSGESAKLFAPLPVVGFRLQYNILPELSLIYSVDYFFITFDEVSGLLNDSLFIVDYRITHHFGMGVGVNSTTMRLKADIADKVKIGVNHDVAGGLVYATMNF